MTKTLLFKYAFQKDASRATLASLFQQNIKPTYLETNCTVGPLDWNIIYDEMIQVYNDLRSKERGTEPLIQHMRQLFSDAIDTLENEQDAFSTRQGIDSFRAQLTKRLRILLDMNRKNPRGAVDTLPNVPCISFIRGVLPGPLPPTLSHRVKEPYSFRYLLYCTNANPRFASVSAVENIFTTFEENFQSDPAIDQTVPQYQRQLDMIRHCLRRTRDLDGSQCKTTKKKSYHETKEANGYLRLAIHAFQIREAALYGKSDSQKNLTQDMDDNVTAGTARIWQDVTVSQNLIPVEGSRTGLNINAVTARNACGKYKSANR